MLELIQSDTFFEGRYKDKVIQVDSSRTGADEEEMITRLLKVEHTEEPTEIVIHVNMLKEGWDVTNLYTIVPLRAANARTLIEQSIGRGLRLPYGKRTGVTAVDRLNIVAHDRFQEIIDEANKPDSAIRLQAVVLDSDQLGQKTATVVSQSQLATKLGLHPSQVTSSTTVAGEDETPLFTKPAEQKVAQIAWEVIRKLESQPQAVPTVGHLKKPEIQAAIVKAVEEQHRPVQLALEGVAERPDIAAVVAKTVDLVTEQTIDIPRILVVPKGEVKSGFKCVHFEAGYTEVPNRLRRDSGYSICAPASLTCLRWGAAVSRRRAWRTTWSAGSSTLTTLPTTTTPISCTTSPVKRSSTFAATCQKRIRARSCAAISGTSPGSSTRRCKSITGRRRPATRSRSARASPS